MSQITENELQRYHDLNRQKKEIEHEMNQMKKQFHAMLDDTFGKLQKGEIQYGGYKLQRQIRTSISYHDEDTVQKLENLNLGDFIVVKKRPDTEKLEAAIELGLVEEKEFSDCKRKKQTQTIVVRETFSS